MLSCPPATMQWASPALIAWAPSITALRPEPHTLLIVTAPTLGSIPALICAWRAGACPCPPWTTWPIRTSSIWVPSTPARSMAALMAMAPRSEALRGARPPRNLPIGVRAAPTMNTSGYAVMGCSRAGVIVMGPLAIERGGFYTNRRTRVRGAERQELPFPSLGSHAMLLRRSRLAAGRRTPASMGDFRLLEVIGVFRLRLRSFAGGTLCPFLLGASLFFPVELIAVMPALASPQFAAPFLSADGRPGATSVAIGDLNGAST